MKVYRLKHKPTGLFYTPSKGNGNLSKRGKLYADTKPQIKWGLTLRIKFHSFRDEPSDHHKIMMECFGLEWGSGMVDEYVQTQEEDWIIEIVE
jgi:hypothetical protein